MAAQGKLTFVVTTNPFDASSAANKKQVRSIAALKSWPERRKRSFEQFENSPACRSGPPSAKAKSLPAKQSRKPKLKADAVQKPSRAKRTKLSPPNPAGVEITIEAITEPPLFEKCSRSSDENCACTHCCFERTICFSTSCNLPHHQIGLSLSRRRSSTGATAPALPTAETQVLTPPSSPPATLLRPMSSNARSDPPQSTLGSRRTWFDRILHRDDSMDDDRQTAPYR